MPGAPAAPPPPEPHRPLPEGRGVQGGACPAPVGSSSARSRELFIALCAPRQQQQQPAKEGGRQGAAQPPPRPGWEPGDKGPTLGGGRRSRRARRPGPSGQPPPPSTARHVRHAALAPAGGSSSPRRPCRAAWPGYDGDDLILRLGPAGPSRRHESDSRRLLPWVKSSAAPLPPPFFPSNPATPYKFHPV